MKRLISGNTVGVRPGRASVGSRSTLPPPTNSEHDQPFATHPPIPPATISSIAVVTCFFNPAGFTQPLSNYFTFAKHISDYPVDLFTIELSYSNSKSNGPASFEIPEVSHNPHQTIIRKTGTRRRHTLWQKERLLNILIDQIVDQYDAIAWIDSDVIFNNRNWTDDAKQMLETHAWGQLFRTALIVDSNGELEDQRKATGWYWKHDRKQYMDFAKSHPGFAWIARSSFLKETNGLYDRNITGGGDTAMVKSLEGCSRKFFVDDFVNRDMLKSYSDWSDKANSVGAYSFGHIPGDIIHLYHGSWSNRKYVDRLLWLKDYHPERDVEIDDQGLLQWTDRALRTKREMVTTIRNYFPSRKEDERKFSIV
jgi:hypothetical protein